MENKFEIITAVCFIFIMFGGLYLIIDRDSFIHIERVDWWTNVLCSDGTAYQTTGYDICRNSTGTFRAYYYGYKCPGPKVSNLTSSCGPYWHMKEVSSQNTGSGKQ